MRTKLEQAQLDAMHKDMGNWKGVYYVNSKDPRIRVPKIYPMLGWTLNLGNTYSYIILFLLLTSIILSSLFLYVLTAAL